MRWRFKSGGVPLAMPPPSLLTNTKSLIRREGKPRSSERDIKRFMTYLTVERGDSPHTVKRYVRVIKQLKKWAREKRKGLAKLTTTDCKRWLICLSKETNSASTINVAHSAANTFFRFLKSEGDLRENPFEPLPYRSRERTQSRFLTPKEVERLMKAPDTSNYNGLLDRAVMELFYSSGMRLSELINLRPEDINQNKRVIKCIGKRGKERLLVFGKGAQVWLKRYLEARSRVPGARWASNLFLKGDGKKLYGVFIWRRIRAHGQKSELKNVSPHVLRHSFATHLYHAGASIKQIQILLGHEDTESTEVYTHPVCEHLRKSYDQYHARANLNHHPVKRRR